MFRPMVKREVVNFEEMCRMCLVQTNDLIGIFFNNENCSLPLRIMACLALEVQPTDALPKSICLECRQLLEKFYFFRKKSKTSDSKMRRHLRLLNAGKISRIFETSDDEDDDDDTDESRRLFDLWDHEKRVADTKALELKKESDARELQKAIGDERARFRATEAMRIAADLRVELEPDIREQVEQELRTTLEPLMREQIEKQIELVVKQKQVEEIRREVQEALKGQKEEMMSEYRKLHGLPAAVEVNKKNLEIVVEEERMHSENYDEESVEPEEENVFDVLQQHPEPIAEEEMSFQDYEVLYEESEANEVAAKSTKMMVLSKAEPSDSKSLYTVIESSVVDEEDGISISFEDDPAGDVESEVDQQSYAIDEADKAEGDESSQPNEDDLYIIGDNITEYLEEADSQDVHMAEDGEPAPAEADMITESLRQTIESYTGVQMHADYKYKIKKIANSKKTKVEVTTDEGQVLVVELVSEGPTKNDDLDENGEMKIFQCDKCEQSFARRIQLSRHMSTHDQRRGHMCEFCYKTFPSKSSMDRHVRTHTGEKPFKCKVCDRSFIQKEILRRHEVIHTGERPFACDQCDKTFTQREVLRQHINRHHTDIPVIDLHKCPKCPKSFFHASGLSRHILVHSGRRFLCDHCEKPFSDKSALKRHVLAIHEKIC